MCRRARQRRRQRGRGAHDRDRLPHAGGRHRGVLHDAPAERHVDDPGALREGAEVALTPQEFKIVKFMTQNLNRVISREELLNDVWGYQNYPTTRTVDNHILKLRQKLETDPANPVHFRTVHGVGYKFVP